MFFEILENLGFGYWLATLINVDSTYILINLGDNTDGFLSL